MKIAIYDPNPRICGPTTWAHQLKAGFIDLGHECQVVTATSSGKPRVAWGPENKSVSYGARWSPWVPDATFNRSGLVQYLNSCQLVILTEPKIPAVDRAAFKEGKFPLYIEAM